jgi:hypothetical protein
LLVGCSWFEGPPTTVEAPVAVEAEPAADDERKRKKGRKHKETTPLFKAFQTMTDRDFEAHILGGEGAPEGTQLRPPPVLTKRQREEAAALAALGYVDGEVEAKPGSKDGVRRWEKGAWEGYNLLTPGGHSVAVLMDMAGNEVHRWGFRVVDAWPSFRAPEGEAFHAESFRRAQVMPNGDLIGLWSGYAIARIDKDSKLVWGNFLPVHHDFEVLDDGGVMVLTRVAHHVPRIKQQQPIVEDYLTWLDPQGRVVNSMSVLEAFEAYDGYDEIWRTRPKQDRDLFHTNTVHLLREDWSHVHPAFKKGRVLTSMRHLDAIALIDTDATEVVWALKGTFSRQHDPQVVVDGRLLLFDNQGGEGGSSRVLEYDLTTGELAWAYQAMPASSFASGVCGHTQRLPNGNTLVNESTEGRAFELTPEGEIVWEYRSSFRTTRVGKIISRNYEFWRLPRAEVEAWLE